MEMCKETNSANLQSEVFSGVPNYTEKGSPQLTVRSSKVTAYNKRREAENSGRGGHRGSDRLRGSA